MIPEDVIDHVRQATDIVQVVGLYLRLKKRGRNYIALCPFHTEKTPSFNVNVDRQIYHCFGCGKGGNVFSFLMEHEKMTFVEAVRFLARRANIVIPEPQVSDRRRELLERLSYAQQIALEYFARTLREARYRNVLDDYVRGRRRLTDQTIDHFQLGLAGNEWDGLLNYAARKDLTADDLVQAGLALQNEKKGTCFDRFRQRLMIPILNLSQKPIAFGGRTLKKGEPAKYINSPETPLYVKGNVLYGLNFAREAIRDVGTAIVVEGYFDLMTLWQAGIRNVVASSGTAFTAQQARLLARFAQEVGLFFDADSAGQQAALRSVDVLYDAGLEVKVMRPPEGEDPDSLARKQGAEAIERLKVEAIGYVPFRVQGLDTSALGIIGKEKLIKELAGVATRIDDTTRRRLFVDEAAAALAVDAQLLLDNVAPAETAPSAPPKKRGYHVDEFDLLSLLCSNPSGAGEIFATVSPDDFDSRELSRVYAAMANQFERHHKIDVALLSAGVLDEDFLSLLSEIAAKDWDEAAVNESLSAVTAAFRTNRRKKTLTRLHKELGDAEAAGDTERANRLLREIRGLSGEGSGD